MVGLREVLTNLRSAHIPIGLASSSSKMLISGILKFFEIGDFFDTVVSAEGLPYGKPHPEVFLRTASLLNANNPLKTIVIEDSINGIIAAKSARMKCVAMPDQSKKELMQFSLADQIISHLPELNNNWWESLID